MKIGILTWSKIINHGAVLQAYASQQTLLLLGYSPVMLDYEGNRNGKQKTLLYRLKHIGNKLSYSALKTRSQLKTWDADKKAAFEKFRNEKIISGYSYKEEKGMDAVLIGSDMVFDFFEGYNPFMYGKDVNAPYIFSYAACFGYVNIEMFNSYEHRDEIIHYIKKLNGVGYRDDNTFNVLKKCCGITDADKNIDPVLLYGFKDEAKLWDTGKWKKRNYILVYSYTFNMDSRSEVRAIRRLANQNNLDVVSVGYMHDWCDESINAGPEEFVEMFNNAAYVVTDTFHGTVFSLIFGKQFCTIIRNNAFKVLDLLREVGLEEFAKVPYTQRILDLPNSPIDYVKVNQKIEKLRNDSRRYIMHQVKEGAGKSD